MFSLSAKLSASLEVWMDGKPVRDHVARKKKVFTPEDTMLVGGRI